MQPQPPACDSVPRDTFHPSFSFSAACNYLSHSSWLLHGPDRTYSFHMYGALSTVPSSGPLPSPCLSSKGPRLNAERSDGGQSGMRRGSMITLTLHQQCPTDKALCFILAVPQSPVHTPSSRKLLLVPAVLNSEFRGLL